MRVISALFVVMSLVGCATGYETYYRPHFDPKSIPGLQTLSPGELPRVMMSKDLHADVRSAIAKGYVPIGESSFNGSQAPERGLTDQAKKSGAVLVIASVNYTGTRLVTTPTYVPTTQLMYGTRFVPGPYGPVPVYTPYTTYGTALVPMTTAQQQFDQTAVFFARSLGKPRVGTLIIDLPPELRTQMQRNTGAYVDIVLEDSPAFAANILGGDVITEINGVQVINAKQATEIFESPQSVSTPLSLKIVRNGSERVIVVPPRAR
jgi:hypothetical protein